MTLSPTKATKTQNLPEVNFSDYGDVRCLHLGTEWIQGTMLLDAPFDIELEYVQRMMVWLLFLAPETIAKRKAMQLGLGAGTITKFCYKKLRMHTTAIEINPNVFVACKGWFKLPAQDARLRVIIADAGQEICRPQWQGTVDALQVDLYDHEAAAPVLDSSEFYLQCRNVLTEDGCMTVNLFGRSASFESSLAKIVNAFQPAGQSEVNAAGAVWVFRPTKEGNAIVLALRKPQMLTLAELQNRAAIVQKKWALPAQKWLKVFKPVMS